MRHLAAVQPAEVQAAAKKHFDPAHRLTVVTVPKAAEGERKGGQR
jgi:hypothetical protein